MEFQWHGTPYIPRKGSGGMCYRLFYDVSPGKVPSVRGGN